MPHSGFEHDVSIRINRVTSAAQECLGQSSIRRKIGCARSVACDSFSGVAAEKEPFAGRPFELNHIQRVFVCAVVARIELRRFAFHREPRCRSGNVCAYHGDFRIKAPNLNLDATRSEPGNRIEGRKMIETLIKRQFIFDGSGMIPPHTRLGPSRKGSSRISERYAGRQFGQNRPSLIGYRNAAWCEAGRPDRLDRICAFLKIESRRCDGKKVIVHDCQEVARSKTIGRGNDVALSPTDKVFSNCECQRPVVIRRAQPPDLAERPPNFAILPRQLEIPSHLPMCVDAKV